MGDDRRCQCGHWRHAHRFGPDQVPCREQTCPCREYTAAAGNWLPRDYTVTFTALELGWLAGTLGAHTDCIASFDVNTPDGPKPMAQVIRDRVMEAAEQQIYAPMRETP